MIPGFTNLSFYELLDISMGVDQKEIQEGYYLVREAFSKSALASYSLYTQEERDEILKLVEEAYHILFDEQSRRDYDKSLAERVRQERLRRNAQPALPFEDATPPPMPARPASMAEIPTDAAAEPDPGTAEVTTPVFVEASTDPGSTPEAATSENETEPLSTPAARTEEEPAHLEPGEGSEPLLLEDEVQEQPEGLTSDQPEQELSAPAPAEPEKPAEPPATSTPPPVTATVPSILNVPRDETTGPRRAMTPEEITAPRKAIPADDNGEPRKAAPDTETTLPRRILPADEPTGPRRAMLDHLRDGVTGGSLKRVRESLGLTLDQAWEVTRIRRPILQSIEEEEFEKLPAAVFLRGMVVTYAKYLGLPDPETAAKSYMDRFAGAAG